MVIRYYGIRQLYPRLRFLGVKVRALLANSRPLTLLLPILGGFFVIEASLPELQWPTPDPLRTWVSLLVLMLFNAGGNQVNSVFDVEIDRVNKPTRPIPSGILSRRLVMGFGVGLMGVAGALSLTRLSNPTFVVLAVMILVFTLAYSVPPIRLKKRLWWNIGSQAFIRGVLGPLAAWSIYAPLTADVFAMTIVVFLFILAAQSSKDFPDVKGDAMYGVRTLPVAYGSENALDIMRGLLVLPILAQVELIVLGVLPRQTGLMLLFTAPLILVFAVWIGDTRENPYVENTKAWVLFYAIMLVLLLGFTLTL